MNRREIPVMEPRPFADIANGPKSQYLMRGSQPLAREQTFNGTQVMGDEVGAAPPFQRLATPGKVAAKKVAPLTLGVRPALGRALGVTRGLQGGAGPARTRSLPIVPLPGGGPFGQMMLAMSPEQHAKLRAALGVRGPGNTVVDAVQQHNTENASYADGVNVYPNLDPYGAPVDQYGQPVDPYAQGYGQQYPYQPQEMYAQPQDYAPQPQGYAPQPQGYAPQYESQEPQRAGGRDSVTPQEFRGRKRPRAEDEESEDLLDPSAEDVLAFLEADGLDFIAGGHLSDILFPAPTYGANPGLQGFQASPARAPSKFTARTVSGHWTEIGTLGEAMERCRAVARDFMALPGLNESAGSYRSLLYRGMETGRMQRGRAKELAAEYGKKWGEARGILTFVDEIDDDEALLGWAANEVRNRVNDCRNLVRAATQA